MFPKLKSALKSIWISAILFSTFLRLTNLFFKTFEMKKVLLLVVCIISVYTTSFSQSCDGPLTVTIQGADSGSPLEASESNISQPSCNGPNGSIEIDVSGGTPDYEIQWKLNDIDFSTNEDLFEVGAGTYTVIISDASGCSVDLGPFVITEPSAIAVTGVTDDPSCNTEGGTFNGSISIEVEGGAGDYTFAWSTTDGSGLEESDEDQTGLGGGTYSVVVTDASGCTGTAEWTLSVPDLLAVSLEHTDPDCNSENGDPNGTIALSASGGTGEYSYAWSSEDGMGLEADAADQSGLGQGTYTVVVSDANGCTASAEVTLEAPTAIVVNLSKVDPTCNSDNGTSDGSIEITVVGGSGEYTFAWSTEGGTGLVEDSDNQSALGTGTYTVIVSDTNGCSETEEITLDGPDAIIVDATTVVPSCYGDQDGSITLNTVSGGAGSSRDDYSYNWNTIGGSGLTTTDASQANLGIGTYMLTITDANGCEGYFEYELTGPEEIVLSVDSQVDPSCNPANGEASGSIEVSASGGSGDFTFTWSTASGSELTEGATSQSGLLGGTYVVVVTDGNGCSTEEEIELITPGEIDLEFTVVPPSCSGANGSIWIAISPEGDEDIYTYDWSTSDGSGIEEGTKNQSKLSPGTYGLLVTNQNGCTVSGEFVVPDVSEMEASAEVTTDILCNGDASGEITVTASGGTGELEYSIDDETTFQSENVFEGLAAGEYTIVIKDENGCTTDVDITVEEPTALTAGTCTEAQDLCNVNEGEIKVEASGGAAPYEVTWTSSNGGTLDQESGTIDADGGAFTFTSAQGGKSYSFVVTDANGCQIP